MNVSNEFRALGSAFDQSFTELAESWDERFRIVILLAKLTPQQRQDVARELDILASSDLSDEALAELWSSTGSQLLLDEPTARSWYRSLGQFLRMEEPALDI